MLSGAGSPNVEVVSPLETAGALIASGDEQPMFHFKATTEVAEGQELCISYVGELAAEPDRRKEQLELLEWGYGISVDSGE